jgi:uncharacterized protein
MKLHADKTAGNYIQSYREGAVLVNGEWQPTGLVISADSLLAGWEAPSLDALAIDDLADVLALDPEVIVLGTGASHRFPRHALTVEVMSRGVGFESMATAAACRTYNILLAEDRRVVAILL